MRPTEDLQSMLSAVLRQYEITTGDFFAALRIRQEIGWTAASFSIFSVNYLYRTTTTAASVARVVVAALSQSPPDVTSAREVVLKNLLDELGGPSQTDAHSILLFNVFNYVGKICFDLPEFTHATVASSAEILDEARIFRRLQMTAYTHNSYSHILGASAAQEMAASRMLMSIRESLLSQVKRSAVAAEAMREPFRYFDLHLDGTEQRHALIGLDTAQRNVRTPQQVADFQAGAHAFLEAQAKLWTRLAAVIS